MTALKAYVRKVITVLGEDGEFLNYYDSARGMEQNHITDKLFPSHCYSQLFGVLVKQNCSLPPTYSGISWKVRFKR